MTRDEMWKRVNDRRTPAAERKQLLHILHKPVRQTSGTKCSSCKRKLR